MLFLVQLESYMLNIFSSRFQSTENVQTEPVIFYYFGNEIIQRRSTMMDLSVESNEGQEGYECHLI